MNLQVKLNAGDRAQPLGPDAQPTILMATLESLRKRWQMVAAIVAIGTMAVGFVVAVLPSRYKSEAILELNFEREVVPSTTSSRQVASMDPGALVNGAARGIGSRANVTRVVERLGLDADPALRSQSFIGMLVGGVRWLVGLNKSPLPPKEMAVDAVLRNLTIAFKANLYVIGTAYTDTNPELAAKIANSLVIEHLRAERLKELSEKKGLVIRELAKTSESFGVLHPKIGQLRDRVKNFEAEIAAVEKGVGEVGNFNLAGQYLTLAEPILKPVSPKRPLILVVGISAALAMGVLAALLAERLGLQFDWLTAESLRRRFRDFRSQLAGRLKKRG